MIVNIRGRHVVKRTLSQATFQQSLSLVYFILNVNNFNNGVHADGGGIIVVAGDFA